VKQKLEDIPGIRNNLRLFPIMGMSRLELAVEAAKCRQRGVHITDVMDHIEMAGEGKSLAGKDLEGTIYDVCVRWKTMGHPLELPIITGAGPFAKGPFGPESRPRLRLRDLVTLVDQDGQPAPDGSLVRPAPVSIYRENGERLVSLKFRARGQSPANALAAAQAATAGLFSKPYRAEWLAP
jgi:hypothetical protein